MFETRFGRELRHLLIAISPLEGSKEWSLIETYFSAVRNVPLPWLDSISGSADIKLYLRQQCLDRKIECIRDFILATQPVLLQNPDEFLIPAFSYSQQSSFLKSLIKLNCHDTGFSKLLLHGNDSAISAVQKECEADGENLGIVGSEIKKLFHFMFVVSVDTGDRQVSDMRSNLRILQRLSVLDNILNLPHRDQWALCNNKMSMEFPICLFVQARIHPSL